MQTEARKTGDLLTDVGDTYTRSPELAEEVRERFRRIGFVQVEDFLERERLRSLAETLAHLCTSLAEELTGRHEVAEDRIGAGGRYKRLDPGFPRTPLPLREEIRALFRQTGIDAMGLSLAEVLTPLISYVVEQPVRYDRIFVLFYREGDYISPHNDAQTGERFNIQFPVPHDTVSALRVLEDGLFKVYYDHAGCMRILGPRVWHEVVPVLKQPGGAEPYRVNLTLRFR